MLNQWNILVVDDDQETHAVTRLVLKGLQFEGISVNLISAFTFDGAKELFEQESNIALILLDVILDENKNGLDFVEIVRQNFKNTKTRIIIRTGQPGEAPEEDVIIKYDINDYKNKIHLTAQELKTCVITCLRSYRDLNKLSVMKDELLQSQKMEAIGTLAGGIAHDFNNILSSILGYSELSLNEVHDKGPLADYLFHILTAGRRAKELVRQILTFSQRSPSEKVPVDIETIIDETFALLSVHISNKVSLTKELKSKDPIVIANTTNLHQIFMNLCLNAYQSLENNTGFIKISVQELNTNDDSKVNILSASGRIIQISVKDNGKGMDKETQEKVFLPFFSTKKQKGNGLGLSTVHGIIKEHGGEIFVSSSIGNGSVFDIYLPKHEKILPHIDVDSKVEKNNENYKVLFIDDIPEVADLGVSMVNHIGFMAEASYDARETLDQIKKMGAKWNMIVIDQHMPKMTGTEFSSEVKGLGCDLPVILTSGFRDFVEIKNLDHYGIRSFLMKPFSLKEIKRIIHEELKVS